MFYNILISSLLNMYLVKNYVILSLLITLMVRIEII